MTLGLANLWCIFMLSWSACRYRARLLIGSRPSMSSQSVFIRASNIPVGHASLSSSIYGISRKSPAGQHENPSQVCSTPCHLSVPRCHREKWTPASALLAHFLLSQSGTLGRKEPACLRLWLNLSPQWLLGSWGVLKRQGEYTVFLSIYSLPFVTLAHETKELNAKLQMGNWASALQQMPSWCG